MIPSYAVYYALQKKLKVGDYDGSLTITRPKILLMNVDDNQNIILSRDKHRKIFYSNR